MWLILVKIDQQLFRTFQETQIFLTGNAGVKLLNKKLIIMSDRRQELERKKQKLALIREEKEKRRREKAKEAEEAAKNQNGVKPEKDLRAQTEELLESLGIPASESPVSRLNSSPRSATPETRSTPPDSQPSSAPQSGSWNSKKISLSLVNVNQVNIPPKEKVNYNKQTQTASTGQDRDAHPLIIMSLPMQTCLQKMTLKVHL
ncbi:putative cytoplasmic dynein intermediate chain isoform 2 [Caerostris extrusa]|uniref:Cytoplasmic dynein intermediate chain isoform 2 n=1 Tax=Caerostris extrusa TaxID=172846 RepID=A0AAV4QG34_CAEEX|nr:putative cytoplasmic dynein intermediate chain isoform 2 [Caerostris extrusa]